MFHADILEMTHDAIAVREKALQPLGIYDDSICWGMWSANPHTSHNGGRSPHAHPNLIISPFHPSSWPFLIRVRLILENWKGALAEAARLLENSNLSILFAECSPTGYTHATWTVIAESTADDLNELRAMKQQFDWDNQRVRLPPGGEYYAARDLANSIAARMLNHVRELEDVFRRYRNDPGTPPLLHEWRAEGDRHFLYNGSVVADEMGGTHGENMDYIRSQIPSPVAASYMQRLAYFAIYGGGLHDEVPFQFKYTARDTLMHIESEMDFRSGSFDLGNLPVPAIGTYNSEEKYLRLCPVTPAFLERERLTLVNVPYAVERRRNVDAQAPQGRQQTYNAKASQGLLRLVCDELLKADIDLLHISNKWTSHAFSGEDGVLSFIADVTPKRHEEVRGQLQSLERPDHLKQVTIGNVTVDNYPRKKLFLSIRLSGWHPRAASLQELVKRLGPEEGFVEVVTVETYSEPALEAVTREIKECDAFLQLLWIDADKRARDINFRWMEKEFDIASAIDMPILQLVDTVRAPYEWWKNRDVCGHPGQYPRQFRLDVSDGELTERIRGAVKELAHRLKLQ